MSARRIEIYEAARKREAALWAHAGCSLGLAVLGDESERRSREHQRAPGSFRSAASILA